MKRILVICFLFVSVFSFAKNKKETVVKISTLYGDMYFILFEDTPLHKENFLKLTKNGFYDSTTFHRIIDNFMIQGGDPLSKDDIPTNDGTGGPGYTIPAEIKHHHVFGSLAAARMGDASNPQKASSGSQFYIVENENGTPFLDGAYTVFGQLISGKEVVNTIASQEKNRADRPTQNIYMKVTVLELSKKKISKKFAYKFS